MRNRFALLAALAIATAGLAMAEDRPLIRPSKDVAVEYRTSGMTRGPAGDAGGPITMHFASGLTRIRIDGSTGQGYVILDPGAGRMIVVMTEKHMYMERPADPGMLAMFQANDAAFERTGGDTIAGLPCTTFGTTINAQRGQICLTSDGVLLRARSTDPDRHRELEAVKVTYADQPAALFEPPPGFQKLDIPDAAGAGRRPMSDFGPPPGAGPRGSYWGSQSGR